MMTDLAQYNLIPIAVAVLVGIVVAYWIFRGSRSKTGGGGAVTPPRSVRRDGPEGNRLTDEFAAATKDVAGEILGVHAHVAIPGPSGPPDNLQTMKGVGPKLAAQLNAAGITRFDQLAALSHNEAGYLDEQMGPFSGRIAKDRLVEQAAYLARGDTDGFEAAFGRLGGA
jgi:predicted flap endonuclease-1-like 5' DNA nuclease